MSALADDFQDDIDTLRREADAVMTADWTGEASDTHSALWQEWVQSARAVVGALSSDSALLHGAADGYDASDADSAGHISSLNMDLES